MPCLSCTWQIRENTVFVLTQLCRQWASLVRIKRSQAFILSRPKLITVLGSGLGKYRTLMSCMNALMVVDGSDWLPSSSFIVIIVFHPVATVCL